MINVATVQVKGKDVEVRELTVAQLDELMHRADGPVPMLDLLFDDDLVTEAMLTMSTGMGADELRSCRPSEIQPIVAAVKEVNPSFLSAIRRRLPAAGE